MTEHQYNGVHLKQSIDEYIHIWMLGTGSPSLSLRRHGIATLMQVNGKWLLFDAGRAVLQRLYECGIPIKDVNNVFFTHLHSDHICGMPDLWMTGWFVGHRKEPMRIFGPVGTARFIDGLKEFHHFDMTVRTRYESASLEGSRFDVTEFEEGIVFDEDGVRVKAFLVDHGPDVVPAYGFKVEFNGRTVVLSGDTTLCEGVIENAKGCDVLIHEIAGASNAMQRFSDITRRIMAIHTDPEQMNRICHLTRPRLTLLHHISLWRMTQYDVIAQVRKGYSGDVELAEDCMEVLVGEDIRIFPAGAPKVSSDFIGEERSKIAIEGDPVR